LPGLEIPFVPDPELLAQGPAWTNEGLKQFAEDDGRGRIAVVSLWIDFLSFWIDFLSFWIDFLSLWIDFLGF
jgi:hypothetical protein